MSAPEWRKGRLLVASPVLGDENFHRTVVLLLEHTPEGAVGVVLNRPSGLSTRETLPDEYTGAIPDDEVIHEGGPVDPESVILLADFIELDDRLGLAVGTIGVVDPSTDFETLPGRIRAIRAFGGYSGWAPGQLEAELEDDAWIDAVCMPTDVFTTEPDNLWSEVLDRKGGNYRLVARMPLDPSLN
jgi:putative transcriptional regulator